MAMTEDSNAGNFSGTGTVNFVGGEANKIKIVKNLVVHNKDGANHTVIIEFVKNGTPFRMFNVTLAPGDSLVQDFLVVCNGTSGTLRGSLGEAATTQPQWVATYAEVS